MGGFTIHLAGLDNLEPNATTLDGSMDAHIENPKVAKASDLIENYVENYLGNLNATPYPRVDNSNLVDGIDRVIDKLAVGTYQHRH